MMNRCECPYFSENHAPDSCEGKAHYIVDRQRKDGAGFVVEELKDVKVCPECKFPEDFNVREIK